MSGPSGGRPPLLIAVGLLGAAVLVLPVVALLVRVPWSDVGAVLGSTVAREALALSIGTSLAAAAISVLLGVPLAWLLASGTGRPAAIGR
ncbi:MAG: hypothetical protein ACKO5A_10525, partial [Actinomycetota bacterium]